MSFRQKSLVAGFTMVELLIVMSVVAVLFTVIGASSFMGARAAARDTKRKSDLNAISRALEDYYTDYNRYPPDDDAGHIATCGASGDEPCDWGDDWVDENGTVYIKLPQDVNPEWQYYYRSCEGGNSCFMLWSMLEREDDPSAENSAQIGSLQDPVDCGEIDPETNDAYCLYGVTSSDISTGWNVTE